MTARLQFFEQQRLQRQRTWLLLFLYFPVVGGISLLTGLAIPLLFHFSGRSHLPVHWAAVQPVALATFLIICVVSLLRILTLREGGQAIARLIGAAPVLPNDQDPFRKRLLNIVEEMALASGTPVPKAYVMEGEPNVNALAAGFEISDAVIVVTQGALELLSRDELQGVVAHEFSHILNGDMKLNIKLTGAVAGLVFITEAGRFMLNARPAARDRRGGSAGIFGLGALLVGIGSLGVLCARLLQAAISRGREVLADASACQFTRNPAGLAAALAKVKFLLSSIIDHARSEQTSHFFFAQAFNASGLMAVFSTHPPLENRIQALDPSYLSLAKIAELKHSLETIHPTLPQLNSQNPGPVAAGPLALSAVGVLNTIGRPQTAHFEYALRTLDKIPGPLRSALRTAEGAKAAVIAVALSAHPELKRQVREAIATNDPESVNRIDQLCEFAASIPNDQRLNLVFLSQPALKDLPLVEKQGLIQLIEKLMGSDCHERVFEFSVLLMLKYSLFPGLKAAGPQMKIVNIRPVAGELQKLYLWLCQVGHLTDAQTREAFATAFQNLSSIPESPPNFDPVSFDEVEAILLRLRDLPAGWKERIVRGMWVCIFFDQVVEPEEAEAARAICTVLNVPIPPIISIPQQDRAVESA